MPRRVAGTIWAIRITMDLNPVEEEPLFNIPNMVCVFHAGGSRSGKGFKDKPHYHLYYNAGEEVVKEKVQELVRSNDIVQKYYKASNGFWSIDTKPEYDLDSYWTYVWKDYPAKKQRLIFWNIPVDPYPIPSLVMESPGNIIATGPLDAHRGRVSTANKKLSLEKQQKFLKHVKEYYEGKDLNAITPTQVIKRLYDYCGQNGFTTEACCYTWVNYVMANIHTGEAYKESRSRFVDRIFQKFF